MEINKIKTAVENIGFSENMLIEITGDRHVTVFGENSILDYSDEIIKISLKKSIVTISGKDIFINSFDDRSISLSGNFTEISFARV